MKNLVLLLLPKLKEYVVAVEPFRKPVLIQSVQVPDSYISLSDCCHRSGKSLHFEIIKFTPVHIIRKKSKALHRVISVIGYLDLTLYPLFCRDQNNSI